LFTSFVYTLHFTSYFFLHERISPYTGYRVDDHNTKSHKTLEHVRIGSVYIIYTFVNENIHFPYSSTFSQRRIHVLSRMQIKETSFSSTKIFPKIQKQQQDFDRVLLRCRIESSLQCQPNDLFFINQLPGKMFKFY